jgi:hypothetical protein
MVLWSGGVPGASSAIEKLKDTYTCVFGLQMALKMHPFIA